MRLVRRAAFGWGPTSAGSASPREGLVIHYDGSSQGLAGKPHSACVAYWQRTRAFHIGASRGWADIGYSWGACSHGYIFEGRGEDRAQAAQPGGNTTWYSVTLMSGPGERPTAVQVDAVRQLRAYLMSRGMKGAVRGHRDFFPTSCPGDVLYAMVRAGVFARPPAKQQQEEDEDMDVDGVWHDARVVMDKGESGERAVSPAAMLQHLEAEQDRIKARLDEVNGKLDALLARAALPPRE